MRNWMTRSGNDDKKLKRERERYQARIAEYGEGYVDAPTEILRKLDRNTLNQLPAETLERLPLDRLRILSVDALAKLSPETLSRLPPEDIARLPSEKLATIPPGALATLPTGYLQKLPPPQLGLVLPKLPLDVLTTISLSAIAKVDPRQLANIPEKGLTILFDRYPDLLLNFENLPHDHLLRLPYFVLSRLDAQTFWSIPVDVWESQPDGVLMNLPPEVRKILTEKRASLNGHIDQPPTVASVESQYKPSLPAAPQFPAPFSLDGSLPPRLTPPAVPPRHHPPISSQNNSMVLRRNNSHSTSRSRTSSPSRTYRNQAAVFLEGSSTSPERKESWRIRDGGDGFREDSLSHRPVPPTPDGTHRKDVADTWKDHMIEKLSKDVSAKDMAIEELTIQIRDKERWDKKMDDERANLNAQIIELSVAKQASADRINKCVDRMNNCLATYRINPTGDRPQTDLADVTTEILNYLEVLRNNADENFSCSTELRGQIQSQVNELHAKNTECQMANDELRTLKYTMDQYEKQLLTADANQATWNMTENALKRERDGLSIQVNELRQRVEKEKEIARGNMANQHALFEAQTKSIKQQNLELQRQLKDQHANYGTEMKKQHDYYEGVRKNHEAQIETLKREHKETLLQVKKQWEEDIKAQKVLFDEHLAKSRSHYEEQLKSQRQAHELALKNNAVHLQAQIKSLESDLVDNSDDFRPATDDSLKTSYGKLKLMVETITETFNLGVVTIPQDGRLDPDNFLGREGKGQTRVLLRSIVWTRIIDGFFSSPFGFGSFGSGSGKKLLVELYSAWRKLFDDGSFIMSGFYVSDEAFELFRTDKEANKWRSATFQSILMAVNPKGKKGQPATGELVRPFTENRQKVHDDILDVLNLVCNNQVQPEIAEKVVEIVQLAGELALEFGSQRAELALDVPAKGESITIGPEFVDCEDGESARGKLEEVELLVLPKLFRVGDGRNDLKSRKIIVPGEIYPKRS